MFKYLSGCCRLQLRAQCQDLWLLGELLFQGVSHYQFRFSPWAVGEHNTSCQGRIYYCTNDDLVAQGTQRKSKSVYVE
jgi:hypothetical protein